MRRRRPRKQEDQGRGDLVEVAKMILWSAALWIPTVGFIIWRYGQWHH